MRFLTGYCKSDLSVARYPNTPTRLHNQDFCTSLTGSSPSRCLDSVTAGRGLASETSPSCHRISLHGIRLESKMTSFHSKMIHPFEVFRPFLPSWVSAGSSSLVHHVGPDPVPPMAAPSNVSVKKHQHVDLGVEAADCSCNLSTILSVIDMCVVFV